MLLDSEMKMTDHVQHVVRVCYEKLKEITSFRKFITREVTQTLVQSMIVSHLDYCNSLLYGISEHLMDKLQRVQNAAARLILGYRKYDRISAGLMELHWLPVRYRIQFKIAVIRFKVLSTNEPTYLRNMLEIQQPQRARRATTGILLRVPKSNLKTAGDRSFAVSAPKIWNSLPGTLKSAQSLQIFKKKLKTFYFRQAFSKLLTQKQ